MISFGIEFRQEDHRGAGEQRDVARHEQAVGVIDRQRVDQHVLVGEAPVVDQRQRIRREIIVRQHRALGTARWCRRCRGSRRDRRWRARRSTNSGFALAAASVSDPLPSAPERLDPGADLGRDRADACGLRGIAHHQRRLGVGDEIFEFVERIGGVERQIDRAGAHRREIEHEARHRFFGLRGDAVAGLDAAIDQHIRHLPGAARSGRHS